MTTRSAGSVALAGLVALAVAMGIGRFAFTPILPMMLADGVVDLAHASWLASANYLGYLVGALICTVAPWLARRSGRTAPASPPMLVRAGLVATVLLTLAMAAPWPGAWPSLRFAAGVASAIVFVYSSGWCLAALAARGATSLGGVMYAGPGAGIVVSGLLASAMVARGWHAASAWGVFGLLAAVLTAWAWPAFASPSRHRDPAALADVASAVASAAPLGGASLPSVATARPSPQSEAAQATSARAEASSGPTDAGAPGRVEIGALAVAYGVAGLGYIVTATFLPVIARAALPGSPWLDMFWPVFGLGIVVGALLAGRLRLGGDLRRLLAAAYVMQAVGIATSLWSPSLVGFAVGSLLLGLPFTAITFFAMQEVRRLRPGSPASTMGLLTAVYGAGQIAGPPLAAWLLRHSASPSQGFARALAIAAGSLLLGAGLFVVMTWRWPKRDRPMRPSP